MTAPCEQGDRIARAETRIELLKREDQLHAEMIGRTHDRVRDLHHTLLNGGGDGLIHRINSQLGGIDARLGSIELWRDSGSQVRHQDGSGIGGYLRVVPWWGWPILIWAMTQLPAEAWSAVRDIMARLG